MVIKKELIAYCNAYNIPGVKSKVPPEDLDVAKRAREVFTQFTIFMIRKNKPLGRKPFISCK